MGKKKRDISRTKMVAKLARAREALERRRAERNEADMVAAGGLAFINEFRGSIRPSAMVSPVKNPNKRRTRTPVVLMGMPAPETNPDPQHSPPPLAASPMSLGPRESKMRSPTTLRKGTLTPRPFHTHSHV
jgi:hypothetical protein